MSYTTIEAEVHNGVITVKEPAMLPDEGRALVVVLPPARDVISPLPERPRIRAKLPLIQGDGTVVINPTKEELDDSLWD